METVFGASHMLYIRMPFNTLTWSAHFLGGNHSYLTGVEESQNSLIKELSQAITSGRLSTSIPFFSWENRTMQLLSNICEIQTDNSGELLVGFLGNTEPQKYWQHQTALKKLCQVCGQLLCEGKSTSRTGYLCENSSNLLQTVFSIDIREDIPCAHLDQYCHSCRNIIYTSLNKLQRKIKSTSQSCPKNSLGSSQWTKLWGVRHASAKTWQAKEICQLWHS